MILQMDKWLAYYATLAREIFPHANPKAEGSGAAGGLGFAFMTFLNGTLESGIKIVLEETRLSDYIKDADIVVTGEGRLDGRRLWEKLRLVSQRLPSSLTNRYLRSQAVSQKMPLPATARALMPFSRF